MTEVLVYCLECLRQWTSDSVKHMLERTLIRNVPAQVDDHMEMDSSRMVGSKALPLGW